MSILKISWRDHITNEEVRRCIGIRKSLNETIKDRKKTWIGHMVRGNATIRTALEAQVEGCRTRGRSRVKMLSEPLENITYAEIKRRAYYRRK